MFVVHSLFGGKNLKREKGERKNATKNIYFIIVGPLFQVKIFILFGTMAKFISSSNTFDISSKHRLKYVIPNFTLFDLSFTEFPCLFTPRRRSKASTTARCKIAKQIKMMVFNFLN